MNGQTGQWGSGAGGGARGHRQPYYLVRLRCSPSHGWTTRVPVRPYERLTRAEIQRRARRQAVAAFGRHARAWPLIDAERKR